MLETVATTYYTRWRLKSITSDEMTGMMSKYATASAPQPQPPVGRSFRHGRVISALMLREMSSRYGRSPGGYAWALLEPLGAIAVLTILFSAGLRIRTPGLGVSWPLFFCTGILCFQMYQRVSNATASALVYSRALLEYPGVTFMHAIIARFALNFLTTLVVTWIVLAAVLGLSDTRAILDPVPIAEALSMAAALGLGVGALNAYLTNAFPIWGSVWSIATTPLFFLSGILYVFEDMPEFAREFLWWNPIIHLVSIMRRGFYPYYDAAFASPLYVMLVAMTLAVTGFMLLYRHHRNLLTNG